MMCGINTLACAIPPRPVPEPPALLMLAIAAVAIFVIWRAAR